jgi:predicted transcriptional regulator
MMTKKRYTIYLSRALARKFEPVARQRRGAKSAIVEEALRVRLEPPQHPRIDEGAAQRIDDLSKRIATVGRDAGILAETLALFVRYFLTITPVLPESDQESARLLGRERFEVFVAQVAQRLAGNVRLASEVLETIAVDQSDRFAAGSADGLLNGGNRHKQ